VKEKKGNEKENSDRVILVGKGEERDGIEKVFP